MFFNNWKEGQWKISSCPKLPQLWLATNGFHDNMRTMKEMWDRHVEDLLSNDSHNYQSLGNFPNIKAHVFALYTKANTTLTHSLVQGCILACVSFPWTDFLSFRGSGIFVFKHERMQHDGLERTVEDWDSWVHFLCNEKFSCLLKWNTGKLSIEESLLNTKNLKIILITLLLG